MVKEALLEVPYLGISLCPSEAVVGWCIATFTPQAAVHAVVAAILDGVALYLAPYLTDWLEAAKKIGHITHTTVNSAENPTP